MGLAWSVRSLRNLPMNAGLLSSCSLVQNLNVKSNREQWTISEKTKNLKKLKRKFKKKVSLRPFGDEQILYAQAMWHNATGMWLNSTLRTRKRRRYDERTLRQIELLTGDLLCRNFSLIWLAKIKRERIGFCELRANVWKGVPNAIEPKLEWKLSKLADNA